MSSRVGKWLGILGLMLIPLSCTALPDARPPVEGEVVGVQDLASTGAVPLEWGSLVSVTQAGVGATARLWFQDDSGTVRMVAFSPLTMRIQPRATVISRR